MHFSSGEGAIREALGFVYAGHPKLIVTCDDAQSQLSSALAEHDVPSIAVQALETLTSLLESEEQRCNRMSDADADATEDMVLRRVQTDQREEGAAYSGVVQGNLDMTLACLFSGRSVRLRLCALECIGVCLRQGLVNPLRCVERIIALLADRSEPVAAAALEQVLVIFEKHPEFIEARAVQGMLLSHGFQSDVFGLAVATLDAGKRGRHVLLFSQFYALCFRARTKARNRILTMLVRTLDAVGDRASERGCDISFYVAQTLSALPYAALDEAAHVLREIDRLVSLQGASWLDAATRHDGSDCAVALSGL